MKLTYVHFETYQLIENRAAARIFEKKLNSLLNLLVTCIWQYSLAVLPGTAQAVSFGNPEPGRENSCVLSVRIHTRIILIILIPNSLILSANILSLSN